MGVDPQRDASRGWICQAGDGRLPSAEAVMAHAGRSGGQHCDGSSGSRNRLLSGHVRPAGVLTRRWSWPGRQVAGKAPGPGGKQGQTRPRPSPTSSQRQTLTTGAAERDPRGRGRPSARQTTSTRAARPGPGDREWGRTGDLATRGKVEPRTGRCYIALVARGCGSVGRASPCQGEGRGFESRHPLQLLVGILKRRPCQRVPPCGQLRRAFSLMRATGRCGRVVQARVCKTLYPGSIPGTASIRVATVARNTV